MTHIQFLFSKIAHSLLLIALLFVVSCSQDQKEESFTPSVPEEVVVPEGEVPTSTSETDASGASVEHVTNEEDNTTVEKNGGAGVYPPVQSDLTEEALKSLKLLPKDLQIDVLEGKIAEYAALKLRVTDLENQVKNLKAGPYGTYEIKDALSIILPTIGITGLVQVIREGLWSIEETDEIAEDVFRRARRAETKSAIREAQILGEVLSTEREEKLLLIAGAQTEEMIRAHAGSGTQASQKQIREQLTQTWRENLAKLEESKKAALKEAYDRMAQSTSAGSADLGEILAKERGLLSRRGEIAAHLAAEIADRQFTRISEILRTQFAADGVTRVGDLATGNLIDDFLRAKMTRILLDHAQSKSLRTGELARLEKLRRQVVSTVLGNPSTKKALGNDHFIKALGSMEIHSVEDLNALRGRVASYLAQYERGGVAAKLEDLFRGMEPLPPATQEALVKAQGQLKSSQDEIARIESEFRRQIQAISNQYHVDVRQAIADAEAGRISSINPEIAKATSTSLQRAEAQAASALDQIHVISSAARDQAVRRKGTEAFFKSLRDSENGIPWIKSVRFSGKKLAGMAVFGAITVGGSIILFDTDFRMVKVIWTEIQMTNIRNAIKENKHTLAEREADVMAVAKALGITEEDLYQRFHFDE